MIADLKPYSSMKDSGVEWLGEIPKHWEVRKLRSVLRRVTERNRLDLPLLSVVREKGVILRDITSKDENPNFIPDDLTNYKVVRKGQLAMNKMKAWQGSYGISRHDGIVSPAYFIFDVEGVAKDYFHLAIRSKAYVPFFTQASDGVRIGQWDLSQARMQEIPFTIPPLPEQSAIVRYLDYVDQRMQQYKRAKKNLIRLLEEQKHTIIHRAVTRGLNPDIPLKESGVEWLEDVPKHWEIVPLKRFAWFKSGAGFPVEEQGNQDANLPFIKVSDMNLPGNEIWMETAISTVSEETAKRLGAFVFPGRTLIFPKVGGALLTNKRRLLRRPSCIDNNIMGCVIQGAVLQYAFMLLQHLDLGRLAKPGPVPAISEGDVREIRIALPPEKEQAEIVESVSRTIPDLENALSLVYSEIELLREYRTRLIADVVTGKLNVREVVKNLPEKPDEPESLDEADDLINDREGMEDDLDDINEEFEG